MRVRRWSAIGLLVSATIATPSAALAGETGDPGSRIDGRVGDRSIDLYGRHDGAPTGERTTGPVTFRHPKTLTAYSPACNATRLTDPSNVDSLCLGAIARCASTPDPDDLAYWIFTAPAGPPAPGPDDWTNTGQVICRGATAPGDDGVPVVVFTAEDFRRLPLPAAEIRVQPPNRRTLVNVPTNLFTRAATVTIPTTVLGQPVRVRATTRSFRWTYGDDTRRTTADPGGPYPNLTTAHTYLDSGAVTLGLATTYSGEYSVGGRPWQPVVGTATVTSPATRLTVLEAHSHLVSEPLP